MSEEEFIISVVAIVFGTGFAAFIMYNIFSLIRAAIERKNPPSSDLNPQFFRALSDFKKTTERRLNNVEAILTDLEEDQILVSDKSDATGEIEIEDVELRKEVKKSDDGNLRNMLNE